MLSCFSYACVVWGYLLRNPDHWPHKGRKKISICYLPFGCTSHGVWSTGMKDLFTHILNININWYIVNTSWNQVVLWNGSQVHESQKLISVGWFEYAFSRELYDVVETTRCV